MKYELSIDVVDSVGRVDSCESLFTDKAEYETAREDAKGRVCVIGTVMHVGSEEGKSMASPDFLPGTSQGEIALDGMLQILCKSIAEREKGLHKTNTIIQEKL